MRALLEEHVPRVYRFALRLTGDPHQAEDLTQETLLRAWRHRRRLRRPEAARLWLFKIAVNLWRDRLRRRKRRPQPTDSALDEQQSRATPPDQAVIDQEDVRRALNSIDSLPSRQREVLYLHACEELSLVEIGDILGISPQAAKASLSLARRRMRRLLDDVCKDRFPTR